MTVQTPETVLQQQQAFFRTGATLPVEYRLAALKKLREAVQKNASKLTLALTRDLGRSEAEGYLCDVGPVIAEINEIIHSLRRWARPETHFSGLLCFPSTVTRVHKMPYGVCLIISPFNFPILLTLGVLACAIAGGNTAVIKCSAKSAACTEALQRLIADTFPPEYIAVLSGGHDVADACLALPFDKIFYTGSPAVGKHVLHMAADNLVSTALELGGETGNWAVVRADADIRDAARKIAFFKGCNAGQICINVNQVAVAEEVADSFLAALKAELTRQLGEHPELNREYACLINDAAYNRCAGLAEQYRDKIILGGRGVPETRRFAPTVLYPVAADDPIVQQELFCPLLPVVPVKDGELEALLNLLDTRQKPLALYLFTKNLPWARAMMARHQYGGGCINEVCMHMMVKGVPFNGVGHSGMGAYHGVWGFREFTHPATVLEGRTRLNLSIREHPYTGARNKWKTWIVKLLER